MGGRTLASKEKAQHLMHPTRSIIPSMLSQIQRIVSLCHLFQPILGISIQCTWQPEAEAASAGISLRFVAKLVEPGNGLGVREGAVDGVLAAGDGAVTVVSRKRVGSFT